MPFKDEFEWHNGHLAINVKVRNTFSKLDADLEAAVRRIGDYDTLVSIMWDDICSLFWEDSTKLAKVFKFDGVTAEGRSHGWLIPLYHGRAITEDDVTIDDPEENDEEQANLIFRYFTFRREIKATISRAPQMLREALIQEAKVREFDFLYQHSVSLRSVLHQRVGI